MCLSQSRMCMNLSFQKFKILKDFLSFGVETSFKGVRL